MNYVGSTSNHDVKKARYPWRPFWRPLENTISWWAMSNKVIFTTVLKAVESKVMRMADLASSEHLSWTTDSCSSNCVLTQQMSKESLWGLFHSGTVPVDKRSPLMTYLLLKNSFKIPSPWRLELQHLKVLVLAEHLANSKMMMMVVIITASLSPMRTSRK